MQLVAERPKTDTIRAQMNYIIDTGVPPVRYIDWPEMEHKAVEPRYEQQEVEIRNGRPLRGAVMVDPLGMCDGRTIPEKGFILVQRRYKYRTGEVYHIAYNPEHVWYWFPKMDRNEALVFKVFDSDRSVRTRFTAHSAFDDPNSAPNAPPRESIETRTFAFWD